ncbi:MAG TPA: hypothetical protein VMU03_01790 [Gammaproteobacteria bacterium]|nr:hypothetical protein [Gammaproteobacteria bacterium]
MTRARSAALIASLILAASNSADRPAHALPADCDRACLESLVDRYVDALIAHDPSKIPVTPDVRFVENGVQLPLGSALWKTATGRGTYRHYFADTTAEQAGFIGTLREHGQGMILVLRLGVQQRRIAEIEQLAIRTRNVDEYEKLKTDSLWLAPVPEAQRLPRDRLAALVNRYYTGMQGNNPNGDYSFFHKDCNRVEHGRQTTNNAPSNYGHSDIPNFVTLGCEAQFKTGFLGFVTLIRDRRYPVIDEERQTALAFAAFDHNGSIRKIPLSTGQMFNVPPYFSTPRTLTIAEGFRVVDDKLRLIEATLTESAYGMRNVVDRPPAAPARRAGDACDEACARPLVDGLLAAMIAHDPAKAPLDKDVRYTENGQPLAVGDGLWRTLTVRGEHGLYLAGGQDAGVFTPTVETDIPGELVLRIRERQGRITEIEALIVRQEIPMLGKLIGTSTLMAPPQLADFDATRFAAASDALGAEVPAAERTPAARLGEIAQDYAHALYDKPKPIAFADACSARANGVDSVNSRSLEPLDARTRFHPFALSCQAQIDSGFYARVGRLRESRVLLADAGRGIVVIASAVDHPGDADKIEVNGVGEIATPEAFRPPSAYYRVALIKVRGGRIAHVETLERSVFYGMSLGWSG